METVTVDVAGWIVGDGEFGPVAVGDVVVVGLALLTPQPLESTHEATEGHVVLEGDLLTPMTTDGRRMPSVLRTPDLIVCLLEPLDSVDDGPVRLVGRLAVEPYHWAMPGGLWERFPDGVRPWRVQAVRASTGRALDGVPPVEQGGGDTNYVVDLVAVS